MMLLLASDGRQADAFDLFRRGSEALTTSLGVDPGPELRAAYDAILLPQQPPRPEVPTSPAQLPRPLPVFTGRRDDLARADDLLRTTTGHRAPPVIAVDGMPGVGKSAFALHWAHQLACRYPGSQIYLDLRRSPAAAPMTAADALHQLLSSLGIASDAIPLGAGPRAALYRSRVAGPPVLVVLDNAESADQVLPLLPGAPGSLTVITGNARPTALAALGAGLLTLETLPHDEARRLLARLMRATLGDRVRASGSAALDVIVTACDRLPAALVAACAEFDQHPVGSLTEFATGLARRRPGSDVSLRTTFTRSYDALSRSGARLFRLLSLTTGPDISPAAAASLAGLSPGELRICLSELHRTHLVQLSQDQRISLSTLLHAYAREMSDQADTVNEQRAARCRLYQHYRHTAHTAQRLLQALLDPIPPGPVPDRVTPERIVGYADALDWFRAEQTMLEAQINGPGDADAPVWELASTLMPYYQRGALWHDLRATMQTALEAAERSGDVVGQAHASRLLSGAYVFLGDHGRALDLLRRALDIFTSIGLVTEQAYVHFNRGYVQDQRGAHDEAEQEYRIAQSLFAQAGYDPGAAAATRGLADCLATADRFEPARELYEQVAEIYRRTGDRNGLGGCLHGLGEVWRKAGVPDRAAGYYRQAAELWRLSGTSAHEARALEDLGGVLAGSDPSEAVTAWRAALSIYEKKRLPGVLAVRHRIRHPQHQEP